MSELNGAGNGNGSEGGEGVGAERGMEPSPSPLPRLAGEEASPAGSSGEGAGKALDASAACANPYPGVIDPVATPPKPSVCRMVLFHIGGNKKRDWPAVITHVWGGQTVNLHVLGDGSYELGINNKPTSVEFTDNPAGLAHGALAWSWPPRT